MLLIGASVMAPLVLFALVIAVPALPFLCAGWLLWRLIRPNRFRRESTFVDDKVFAALKTSRTRLPVTPFALGACAVGVIWLINLNGFSWRIDQWLGGAMLVIAVLWWVQHRLARRHLFGSRQDARVSQYDLYRLFEVERTTDLAERWVLIVREFNRLTLEVLRSDPALFPTWPSIPELRSIRDQLRLLRSSLKDPSMGALPGVSRVGEPSPQALMSGIESLETYVNRFLRLRLIGHDDLEQIRVLVRDQNRIRSMQDEIVSQLQQFSFVPAAG